MSEAQAKALVLGASGMTGRQLAELMLFDSAYSEVRLLVRAPLPIEGRRIQQSVVDFERLSDHPELFEVRDLFCCLGTTIKKAGSELAFRKVDHDFPLQAAQLALQKGASRFFIMTALGAAARSTVFYNRVKGQLEEDLRALGAPEVHIFRPSLLRGKRLESRPGEEFANLAAGLLSFALAGPLRRYRPIEGAAVARAMLTLAHRAPQPGFFIHESEEIQSIADQSAQESR
ncbi:MAG: oxidoreductase [Leptospirales bacterium]|nr:oxidoreductase [Leptospirales bacterium]